MLIISSTKVEDIYILIFECLSCQIDGAILGWEKHENSAS